MDDSSHIVGFAISFAIFGYTNQLIMRITITKPNFLFLFLFAFAAHQVSAQGFYDGFESGTFTPTWVSTGGTYAQSVPSVGSAVGTYNFQQSGTGNHLQGVKTSFVQEEVSEVSFYAKTSDNTASGAYFVLGDAGMTTVSNSIVFLYFSSAGNLRFYAGTVSIDQPVSSDTWYFVEMLNFDWSAKTFDVYIDGVLMYADFPFRDPSITNAGEIHLYNFTSNLTANYDEINVVPACLSPGASALSTNFTAYLDATGNASIVASDVDGGSTVNCGTPNLSVSPSTFSCSDLSASVPVTLYVTDSYGSIDSTTAMVTVLDTLAPTASNPASIFVQCSNAPLPDTAVVNDAFDNCSAVLVSFVGELSDGLSCPETITRTYSVTDPSGNELLVSQLIIIGDTIAPLPDSTLATINSSCAVTPVAPTATDGCSGAITATPDLAFPITSVGTTTITWTYTDDCGNAAVQTQDVIIGALDVTTSAAGITITANASGLMYQWIDCGTGQAIANATAQDFTASANGDYAVIVTDGTCSDTSACVTINQVSLGELISVPLVLYPNPSSGGMISIKSTATITDVLVFDLTGRSLEVVFDSASKTLQVDHLATGNYTVIIKTEAHGDIVRKISIAN